MFGIHENSKFLPNTQCNDKCNKETDISPGRCHQSDGERRGWEWWWAVAVGGDEVSGG